MLEVGPGNLLLTTAFRKVFGDSVELSVVEHPEARYLDDSGFRRTDRACQKVELALADILIDPLPFDGGFDAVLFCGVIEHLEPTAVLGLLERLRGQLAGAGRLVISSTNLAAFVRVASLAFGHGEVMAPPVTQGYGHGHIRLYTRRDMEVLVDHAGMQIAEWRYLNCERVYIGRANLRGRLLYTGQAIARAVVAHTATSWVCSTMPAADV